VENAEALPNPWSRVVNQNQAQPAAGTDAGGAAGGLPFASKNFFLFNKCNIG
jgi:hypothetical protein